MKAMIAAFAMVVGIFAAAQVVRAQTTTPRPSPTLTPTQQNQQDTSTQTTPQGAPQTGFGGMQ